MHIQDFHLAKRYYDLSLETNVESYLPVTLSLVRLHLRSLYKAVIAGDIKAISLFLSNDYMDDDEVMVDEDGHPLPEAEQQQQRARPWFWSWRKVRDEFFKRWMGEEMARQEAQRQIQHHEARGQEGHAGIPAPPAAGQQPAAGTAGVGVGAGAGGAGAARARMEAQDDPVDWARRRREEIAREQQLREDDLADDLDIPDFFGDTLGGRGAGGDDDDFLETLAIVGLCLVLGWLVYIRQARYDGARAQQRQEERQRRGQQHAVAVPVPPTQEPAAARQRQSFRAAVEDEQEDEPRP